MLFLLLFDAGGRSHDRIAAVVQQPCRSFNRVSFRRVDVLSSCGATDLGRTCSASRAISLKFWTEIFRAQLGRDRSL